jgi:hypothetical protein
MYRYHPEQQTEYYKTLVNKGGRPSHPVSLGRDVIENPGEYREILSYWQSVAHTDRRVFESRMGGWRESAAGNERTERKVAFLNMSRG